jgi:hypothetical protein
MDGKDLKVKRGTTTVWSSGVFNDSNPSYANSATVPGPYKISLQNDGNLVVYGANNFVWSAAATSQFNDQAPKKAPYKLTLEADGQLTIRDSEGTLVWKNVKPSAKWSSPIRIVNGIRVASSDNNNKQRQSVCLNLEGRNGGEVLNCEPSAWKQQFYLESDGMIKVRQN